MSKDNTDSKLTLCSVGDVNPKRDEPEKMFDLCSDVFKEFDLRMCVLETNFVGGQPAENWGDPEIPGDPSQIKALTSGGFDIATCAGNHALFGGIHSLVGGLELLHKHNIGVVGAGKNIAEARRPLMIERKGTKLAFLNYNSVLKEGDWAEESKPGVAPLRVKTCYEMLEHQPGVPAKVFTFADYDDLDAMLDDIKEAKAMADVVILSLHWGIHFMPVKLASFQRPIARYAIDAGADIIIGAHPHILKGVEVYKGKFIFYSIGNFAFDSFRTQLGDGALPPKMAEKREVYGVVIDPAWAKSYPYSADSRKTLALKIVISDGKIEKVSFLPAMIQIDARPKILKRDDPEFDEVLNYMQEVTQKAGLNASFTVEDDEVIVSGNL